MSSYEEHKNKTAKNREESTKILQERGIDFLSRNNGAHLIVQNNGIVVDFWPGTGKYIVRESNIEGRGVFNLIKWLASRAN
jgi:hypothetical protein